jgi:hypothetical protein
MSDARSTVNAWLAQWEALQGPGALQLDERGLLGLQTDSGLQIELEVPEAPAWLYLRAALRRVPEHGREAWYGFLLARNFLCQSTGGAVFALDAEQQQLALTWCQPVALLDAQAFSEAVMGFIDQALHWSEALAHGLPDEMPEPDQGMGLALSPLGMTRA